jgi:hypothetical protein
MPEEADRPRAGPLRGTVLLTARCRWCDQVLYRYPNGAWWHDEGGFDCAPADVAEWAKIKADEARQRKEARRRP